MLCSDMAGVELNLKKGICGTQCPHLSSDLACSPTDNGSTALSKSKKKRLRKKKKVETQTAVNSEVAQLPKTVEKDANISHPSLVVEVRNSKAKKNDILSVADINGDKHLAKPLEVPQPLNKSVEGSHATGPAVQISKAKKAEENSKRNKIEDVHPAVDSKPNHSTTTTPQKTSTCSAEASRTDMDSNKVSRDDVKAQREAKKLAKLAKKNKAGAEGAPSPVSTDSNSSQPKSTPQKPKPSAIVQSAQNSSPVASVTTQINQMSLDTTDGEVVKPIHSLSSPKTGPLDSVSSGNVDKSERSREEVLAEREAKRLAKLAVKNKKKDGVTEVSKDKSKDSQTAPIEDKAASKSGDLQVPVIQKEVNQSSGQEKSKAELRAERRAKQEAQRAAKEGSKKVNEQTKPAAGTPAIKSVPLAKEKPQKAQSKPPSSKTTTAKSFKNQPKLLSHLLTDNIPLPSHIYQHVHPAVVELGAKYAARVVSGSNARCVALLQVLKKVIVDFVTPREKEFSRAMETRLNDSMAYLNSSRQSSVSMTNALKHVKSHLTQLTTEKTTDDDARKKLCEVIDTFIKEQIDVAGQAISLAVAQKISNGDTIAIYGCSSLLLRILVESHNEGKDFEVVVVDGGPLYEGREMCRRLVSENIKCTYVLLPAFSYVVGQTTKVLLGAHALLANGCVMSRSGTAVVAMLAKAHNVPVIVCCETYKFSERVQADAFVHNELGPQDKNETPPSISLMYDMTPPTLVDAVATELAILPCTSVPVILRVKPSDVSYYY